MNLTPKLIVQTKVFIFALGFLLLGSCGTKYAVVKSNREEYHINSSVAADSSIIRTYLPYKTKMEATMNEVIGSTEIDLTKDGGEETLLGNFFADAILHQSKKIEPRIDFVFPTTKSGLRNNIAKGNITVSDIFELMPFENELVLVELKGADVLTVLNYVAASGGQPVAGLTMEIKNKTAINIRINGKKFDLNENYFVLTSDYLANGGADSAGFSAPVTRKNINLLVRDALLKEVKALTAAGKKVKSQLDGRITKD